MNTEIETYLSIIKAEMLAEYIDTIDRNFIKEVVLRAGGKDFEIDEVLKHPSVKEIDEDLFYIKTSTS
ncbi:hypothetical protein [Tenacibaculum singaporense]|uniref:Uncharacterized protein n=1 Tax=Tenacibaculum singaporense TaxID=2358479 RepID=A0A3S8R7Z8_9FLAO|nr:hypothetical protein [Tenacibaculum singaporense]AZJ35814.1 hypothetical protein D6T69_09905 [Tenacibaculum singaporense]